MTINNQSGGVIKWNAFKQWWLANWKHLLTLGLTWIIAQLKEQNYNRKLKKARKTAINKSKADKH